MSETCIFCRIASKGIPADIVYEDAEFVAFRDLHPQAPTHVLLIPKRHVVSLDQTVEADAKLLGTMLLAAKTIAAATGLAGGYRVVANCGPDGGQSVSHLHLHLLGGRRMAWPPG